MEGEAGIFHVFRLVSLSNFDVQMCSSRSEFKYGIVAMESSQELSQRRVDQGYIVIPYAADVLSSHVALGL